VEQLTKNIFIETQIRGCNHGFVKTTDGLVLLDTPHKPSDSLKWKAELEKHGPVRYIINTEPHGDHWTGNSFFDAPVVAHFGVRQRILDTKLEDHIERTGQLGPEEPALLKDYQYNPPSITFDKEMTLHVGNHTFQIIHMPGHTPYQAAIVIEEEGVVFTSDNVFSKCHTFIQEGNPEQWLQALDSLRALPVETLVPGHGPVTDKGYLSEQGGHIEEWVEYVRKGIQDGMTKEQAVENLRDLDDTYADDIGHDGWGARIAKMNTANLYDYILGVGRHATSVAATRAAR
jgi:cyclase